MCLLPTAIRPNRAPGQVEAMVRAAHAEEAFAERRAVLECLPSTLHALGLPIVMPKLRANPGKPQPAKYEALVSTARRADGSTKGDAVVARL